MHLGNQFANVTVPSRRHLSTIPNVFTGPLIENFLRRSVTFVREFRNPCPGHSSLKPEIVSTALNRIEQPLDKTRANVEWI